MNKKDAFTEAFLKAANIDLTPDSIKDKKINWWYNVRDKDEGGLRLTEEGINFVQTEADIKTYTIKFPGHVTLTPQILVWLDQQIKSPYHVTKKEITVLSEKDAFELYLFSGDVRKMGYGKALSKRLSQESPPST
jgi:hypothetical protein